MRRIRYDLSNKLTTYGTELIYRKIFDPKTTYDAVFFDDLTTIKKLHLYYSTTQYIESDSEEISIPEYKYLQIDYYFESLPEMEIRKIVLEDSHGEILKLDGQYVATLETDSDNTDEITCVTCRFVIDKNNTTPRTIDEEKVRWTPVIMTDFGLRYIYESLANIRNEKVNFIFTGAGEPNNRFDNCHIDHLLDDVKVSGIRYFNRYCQISGRKPFPYSTTKLNEVGLGFYFHPRLYCKNYLATKDRNWQRKLFPIDRHSNDFPDTLEFDHPVLALRVRNDEYACVWYSGNKGEEDTFPNLSFSAKFYINLIYDMWYSDELIDLVEEEPSLPEKTFHLTEALGFNEFSLIPEPDMTPTATSIANIEDGIAVPKYSALSLDSTTGLYRPITVDNGSTVTLLSSLKSNVYIGFDDVRNMPTVGVYRTSTHLTSISGNRTATNYLVPTTLTLSDTSQITSSEAIISYTLRFSNNQSEANILFKTTNIDNFDISNFALEMYNWSDDEGDWHYYTKGTDFTVSNTISTSRTFVQYTCNITAISNDLISSIAQNNSFHFSLTLAQKQNITFTKDIDFSNSYTYRETSRYKYNTTSITAIPESSLDSMVGWFDVYGYTNTISANPVAIAMQAISADDPRTIQVATAGTFNSSKIPNFVPVFIGDFTFT